MLFSKIANVLIDTYHSFLSIEYNKKIRISIINSVSHMGIKFAYWIKETTTIK